MTTAREALLKRAAEILSREFGERFPEEKPEVSAWFTEYDALRSSVQEEPAAKAVELPADTRLANAPYEQGKRIVGIVIDDDKFQYLYQAIDWFRSMLNASTHPIHLTEDAYYELLGYRADCLLRKSKEEPATRAVVEARLQHWDEVCKTDAAANADNSHNIGRRAECAVILRLISTLPQSAQKGSQCAKCDGTGTLMKPHGTGFDGYDRVVVCPACKGIGEVVQNDTQRVQSSEAKAVASALKVVLDDWANANEVGDDAREDAETALDAFYAQSESGKPDTAKVPEGWKLLKDTTQEERSWGEDSAHENGNYFCNCCVCLRVFVGHKRRVLCKVCAAAPSPSGVEEGK